MGWFELVRYSADSALRSVMGMRPRFWLRRRERDSSQSPNYLETSAHQRREKQIKRDLVHARPEHLEERYGVLDDGKSIDTLFASLGQKLFADTDALSAAARRGEGGKTIFRESGKTSEGRHFIFFKPLNDYGWLMERSGAGWRISRAEKIISQQMFLRSNADPWDIVVVYSDPKRPEMIRVNSQRFGHDLMSFAVYEQRMRPAFEKELLGSWN